MQIGKKLGLPSNVETDHEESETRPQERNRIVRERTPSITEDKEEKLRWNRSIALRNTIPAEDIIRTIKVLTGLDDIRVEDVIKTIEKAREKCSQPELLLDYIIAEKITGQAERAIRYTDIQ